MSTYTRPAITGYAGGIHHRGTRFLAAIRISLFLLVGSGVGFASATTLAGPVQHSSPTAVIARNYPFVAVDSSGHPTIPCGPGNDGENVRTYDAYHGEHLYVCHFNQPVFADPFWEWLEVVG